MTGAVYADGILFESLLLGLNLDGKSWKLPISKNENIPLGIKKNGLFITMWRKRFNGK